MLHVDPVDSHSPVARTLLAELARELTERYPTHAPAEARGDFATTKEERAARSIFLVAWFGSDAVGCGALRPFDPATGIAEIRDLFVVPNVRSKGIGREILHELERHAHGFGYTRLRLEAGGRQPEAVSLYEKAGFTPMPKNAASGHDAHSRCFEKTISPA